MTITIADQELDRKIQQLASAKEQTADEFVVNLIRQNIGESRRIAKPIDRSAIRRLQERVRAFPILDDRDHGDILYDEDGLPG